MPSLGSVASALGAPFRLKRGGAVRGVVRPPPEGGASFDPRFSPRRTLVVSRSERVQPGDVLFDSSGIKFLVGSWGDDAAFGGLIGRSFVLFEVTGQLSWSRQSFTLEPISGQRISSGRVSLGDIEVVHEPLRRDANEVRGTIRTYRCLTPENLEFGDLIGTQKVTHVERVLGLIYAEAE